MTKIKGAYNCSYCHGDIDHACTACDPECNCIELDAHRRNECEPGCEFCESDTRDMAVGCAVSDIGLTEDEAERAYDDMFNQ